jgi:hypothetical protein
MNQHVFFQQFGMPGMHQQPPPAQVSPVYLHNCMILEMATNWSFIIELINKHKNNQLKEVDAAERDWFNFITSNNVNVEKYNEDPELFVVENLKNFE